MHSDRAQFHCILMTRIERYERFAARVEAIRSKGFEVLEETVPRRSVGRHRLLPPALRGRVSARDNPFLSLLGWRTEDLMAPR